MNTLRCNAWNHDEGRYCKTELGSLNERVLYMKLIMICPKCGNRVKIEMDNEFYQGITLG